MGEYVGLDVSKEETSFCVKSEDGVTLARGKAPSDPAALFAALREHCLCPARIVLETGTQSGWLARELGKLGLPVEVIDARQAHAVMKLQHNKTDAGDAELLAELARTGFCRAVAVKSEAAQEARVLLKARAHLVRQRRDTENAIRGLLGSLGIRFPKGTAKLAGRVRAALEDRPELEGDDRAAVVQRRGAEARDRTAGQGRCGADQSRSGVPTFDERARRRTGHRTGLRGHHRRPGTLYQIARGGGLSGADGAALSIRGDGLLGAHIQARRTPCCAACCTRRPTPC